MAFADLTASQQEEERAITHALKCPQCGQRRVKIDLGWVCTKALNCGGTLDRSSLRQSLADHLPQGKASDKEYAIRIDRLVKEIEKSDRKKRAPAKKG